MASWLRHLFVSTAVASAILMGPAEAQQELSRDQLTALRNDASLRLVTGPFGDTSAELAADLANVMADPTKLRVMPVLGSGGLQNLEDLLYLKDVDIGLVRSDVLAYVKKQGIYPDLETKIRYISKLHVEEIHILARSSVSSISDLAGKKVNFGRAVDGGKPMPQFMFETLGVQADPVFLDAADAVQKLKAGEIEATVIINGRPNGIISTLTAQDGVKLLPIEYADSLQDLYLPASLSSEDYPGLIPAGETVDTLATNVVMAIFNWPENNERYKRADAFVKSFFAKTHQLRKPGRHAKWEEVNLAAVLPGWERFQPAQEWLDLYGDVVPGQSAMAKLSSAFDAGFAQQAGAEADNSDKSARFKEFLRSGQSKAEAVIQVHLASKDGVSNFIGTVRARNAEVTVGGRTEVALLLRADLRSLSPGRHAFRLYANPNCEPGEENGVQVAALGAGQAISVSFDGRSIGYQLGRLPDLVADDEGAAVADIVSPRMSLADLHNRSVVIHASDDDTSERQACGVVD